jgi:hypothetical protein
MQKVTFRCVRSGNTVSFSNENDIAALRIHQSYIEVKDDQANQTVQSEPQKAPSKEVLKIKRKPEVPAFLEG